MLPDELLQTTSGNFRRKNNCFIRMIPPVNSRENFVIPLCRSWNEIGTRSTPALSHKDEDATPIIVVVFDYLTQALSSHNGTAFMTVPLH